LQFRPKRTDYTIKDVVEILSDVLSKLKEYRFFAEIELQFFRQLLYYMNCILFNALIAKEELCRCMNGIQIKMALTELDEWASKFNYANELK